MENQGRGVDQATLAVMIRRLFNPSDPSNASDIVDTSNP
jgi:hypothetical protein